MHSLPFGALKTAGAVGGNSLAVCPNSTPTCTCSETLPRPTRATKRACTWGQLGARFSIRETVATRGSCCTSNCRPYSHSKPTWCKGYPNLCLYEKGPLPPSDRIKSSFPIEVVGWPGDGFTIDSEMSGSKARHGTLKACATAAGRSESLVWDSLLRTTDRCRLRVGRQLFVTSAVSR